MYILELDNFNVQQNLNNDSLYRNYNPMLFNLKYNIVGITTNIIINNINL